MGTTICDTMASTSLSAEQKKLHPFFTAPKNQQSDAPSPTTVTTALRPAKGNQAQTKTKMDDTAEPEVTKPKRRKRKSMEEADEALEDIKKPKRGRPKKIVAPGPSILNLFPKTNVEVHDTGKSEQSNAAEQPEVEEAAAAKAVTQVQQEASTVESETAGKQSVTGDKDGNDDNNTPPKKMLNFNPKTGTIGSPPKPKEPRPSRKQTHVDDTIQDAKSPSSKGKRRSKRIATINYGSDDATRIRIGARIDSMLNNSTPPSPLPRPMRKTRTRKSPRTHQKDQITPETEAALQDPKPMGSGKKDTHPFFTGKAKQTAAPAADPAPAPAQTTEAVRMKPPQPSTRPRIFSSTPFSPRKSRPAAPSAPLPQWGVKSLGLKTPGARHPAWPPMGMVHIRGDDDYPGDLSCIVQERLAARKSKGNRIHVATTESLLHHFTEKLEISKVVDTVRNANTDSFLPPPVELRLPQKRLESGLKLEGRVLWEVKNPQHPALSQLRESIVTSLSALDRYTCESVSWTQKYTPKSAVEVLQHGKEAFLLRSWLEAMKVLSVDTGDVKLKPTKPPKKKRKKNKDDFIVDSDEDADVMDEVSDLEEDWSPDQRGGKKSEIRVGDNVGRDSKNPGRLTNTVLISGPHGCGKTSAVYAIAKELDFEVFEINSGSKRSGKDIIEKIGDMTKNHLVQHHQTEASEAVIDEEEVAEDIKSGKQATMNSFFKPKAIAKPAKPKPAKKEVLMPAKTEPRKTSPKNQKQSLILLDEVDILYEEDKQFWSTVITLIAQSKRPFIMTCNEENLVPLQTLSLHGIFRFSTPPPDLAVDRLLLIAGCEGHSLSRTAVAALYDARQHDLRACMMDLNYWCQVAVGDNRGGMDWLIPRWPKGCDLDGDGNTIRVISQDTYLEGMGWLGRDVLCDGMEQGDLEEEMVQEVNDFWDMDLTNWHDSLDLPSWAASLEITSQDKLGILRSYEEFTDALSFADLSWAMTSTTYLEEPIDCTHPEIVEKARDDYISGQQLLDAPLKATYDSLATSLPVTLKCLARKTLQSSIPGGAASKLDTLSEPNVVSRIRQRASPPSTVAALSRQDFSNAFDELAISEKEANSTTSYLDPSVFDGILDNIVVDVAPYVRSILAFERELQRQRQKLSSLLSQGGTKRGRKTRAAHAALEGGSRSTVRRDKWFDANLNGVLVMRTAGEGWVYAVQEEKALSSVASSNSPADSGPRKTRVRRIVTDDSADELCSDGEMDVD